MVANFFGGVLCSYRPKIETCVTPCSASVSCFCVWAILQFKKLKNLVLSASCFYVCGWTVRVGVGGGGRAGLQKHVRQPC